MTIKFTSTAAGYVSNMLIQKIENFSMGQEVADDLNDPTLYKSVFSKVTLEL